MRLELGRQMAQPVIVEMALGEDVAGGVLAVVRGDGFGQAVGRVAVGDGLNRRRRVVPLVGPRGVPARAGDVGLDEPPLLVVVVDEPVALLIRPAGPIPYSES